MAPAAAPMTSGEKYYQPGGAAMFLNGDWTGRVIESTEDDSHKGRWSTMRIQGKADQKIAFICTYRACNQNIQSTVLTLFSNNNGATCEPQALKIPTLGNNLSQTCRNLLNHYEPRNMKYS